MKVLAYDEQPDGVVVATSTGQLKIQAIGECVMRVVFTGRDEFGTQPSAMLIEGLERTAPSVENEEEALVLHTPRLRLAIDRASGAFTWTDERGELLMREPHDRAETKVLEEVDVMRSVFSSDVDIATTTGADGERAVVGQTGTVVDGKAYSTTLRLEFQPGEAIYGLGQHDEGILNYRGKHEDLYQQNTKIVAPMIVSTRGYAVLWDSQSLAAFHDDQSGTYFWTEIDDEMDFLFIVGPEFDDIVEQARGITGDAPMMPRWAYGYIQSKDRYRSSAELLDVVSEFRRRELPLDCIVQDWQSWPEGLWGQKSFDPERYPDPSALVEDLHGLGCTLMVSVWPNMHGDGANLVEFKAHGGLLGDNSTYDACDADARALYFQQLTDGYFVHGVDALWSDCTEPFEADWKGVVKPQPAQRVTINSGELKKYLDPEQMNGYSLAHSRGLYEGLRGLDNGKRAFTLTRSGFVGQQRYGAVTWSGDSSATWDDLRLTIPAGLNLCITGMPFWTVDIGAYFVTPGDLWFWKGDYTQGAEDLGYRELYVRWLQYATFIPVFRSHGRCTPREPWNFGEPGDAAYDTIKAFLGLRYRLLPYLYSLGGWTTHRGYTPMRALVFDFRRDPAVFDIVDQFMLGPSLLVCPVTEAMAYGPDSTPLTGVAQSRPVYLPAGCDWYDFWTGERFIGGRTITAVAPLEQIPVFVRAGSILPLGDVVQRTGEATDGPLEVRIYPGAEGSFDLYDDSGDGYDYERGEHATTPLTWDDASQTLTVGARVGSYPTMPQTRTFNPVVVSGGQGVGIPVTPAADAIDYRGDDLSWTTA